jgi:hypothetical protein
MKDSARTKPLADRLTEPQRRHLREMVNERGKTRYWRPANQGEQRCAMALQGLGLLGGSSITYSDAYYLTDAGLALARGLQKDAE